MATIDKQLAASLRSLLRDLRAEKAAPAVSAMTDRQLAEALRRQKRARARVR